MGKKGEKSGCFHKRSCSSKRVCSCKPFRLYTVENIPPMGTEAVVIPANQSVTISLDAKVFRRGQVKLVGNFNVIPAVRSNILIDVLRDGASIQSGPQQFLKQAGTSSATPQIDVEFNLTYTIIDTEAPVGQHRYSIVLTNQATINPTIAVDFYTVVVKSLTRCCKSGARFVANQFSEPLSTPSVVILAPNGGETTLTLDALPATCKRDQHTKVDLNLNYIMRNQGRTQLAVDLQRNGVSLTGGPQLMTAYSPTSSFGEGNELNLQASVVDTEGASVPVVYTAVIRNQSTDPTATVALDLWSFSADPSGSIQATQAFPPQGTFAITIAPNMSTRIPLTVGRKDSRLSACSTPTRLTASLNTVGQLGFGLLVIDVLRDGVSILANKQTYLKNLYPLPTAAPAVQREINFNLSVVDPNTSSSTHRTTYTLELINLSPFPAHIDFYSFAAEQT